MADSRDSGFDRHREADRFEHRQVAGRIGVGDGLLEGESVLGCVVGQQQGACLANGREGGEVAGQPALASLHLGAHDVVEQWADRLDDEIKRSCDQQRAVTPGSVRPDAGESRRGTSA